MLGAVDLSKQENDLFSSDLHNEDELLYEPESSIINLSMVEDCQLLIDDAHPAPFIATQNSNS